MDDYKIEFICMICHKKTGWPMGVNKSHGGEYPLTTNEEWEKEKKCGCKTPMTGVCVDGTVVAIFAANPSQG